MKLTINNNYQNIKEFLEKFFLISKKNLHILNMDKKSIILNDKYTSIYSKIKKGDILQINCNFQNSNYLINENCNHNIKIEYEDKYLLIVSKPQSMKTHPNDIKNENDTLINFIIKPYQYLEPIHRLDVDTCGLVIFAKNPLVKTKLDYMLKEKLIRRYYTAITNKFIPPQKIVTNLGRDRNEKNKIAVVKKGKKAVTNIISCENLYDNFFQIKISLETGRTHQIRVHLSHIGASIIGDKLYSKDFYKYKNMKLGAFKVEFIHPISNNKMVVYSHFKKTFINKI